MKDDTEQKVNTKHKAEEDKCLLMPEYELQKSMYTSQIIASIAAIEKGRGNTREFAEFMMKTAVKAKLDGYPLPEEYYYYLEDCVEDYVTNYRNDTVKEAGLYKAFNLSGKMTYKNQEFFFLTAVIKELVGGYSEGKKQAKQCVKVKGSIYEIDFTNKEGDDLLDLTFKYGSIAGYKNEKKIETHKLNKTFLQNYIQLVLDCSESTALRYISNNHLVKRFITGR